MSRSKWKGPYVQRKVQITEKTAIVSRNSNITPCFLGATYLVHDGRNFKDLTVEKNMIGHKFGEFVNTRVKHIFKSKKQKKK